MAESPATNASDVVQFKITSNGSELRDSVDVIAIRTRAEVNRIPEAVVIVADGDVASLDFPVTDGSSLVAGAEIEIQAGYGGGSLETIFKGVIVKTRLRVGHDRPFQLEATCRDASYRLTLERKSEVYENQTDSDVISKILSDAGLDKSVDTTSVQYEGLVRQSCTDFDFVLARAEANGLIFYANAGKANVAKPDFSASPVLEVTLGTDLFSFDGEIDSRSQYASASATAWSPDSQQTVVGTGQVDSGSSWGNQTGGTLADVGKADALAMITAANLEQASVDAVAKGRQTRAALARLRAAARFQGSAKAALGTTLQLSGLGDRFSGAGLVCGVSHRIEEGDWTTEVALGHAPEWLTDHSEISAPGAGGLNAAARGLQIGKVVKVAEDPKGGQRIQVKLPLLADDAMVWARLGGIYASSGFGVMFLPEVDDEVIVGFLSEDPSDPIVLGSLYSKDRAPPVTPEEANNTKTVVTREKLKLTFDEEKKVITVETPAGNTAIFDDDQKSVTLKDENGNKVELASGGITLDSPKTITIKAGQDVSISATGSISVSATQSLSLSGLDVSASADTEFSASGNASAKVTSSGQLTIQGTLVMIN